MKALSSKSSTEKYIIRYGVITIIGVIIAITALMGYRISPHVLALYHQIIGGQILASKLAEANLAEIAGFACEMAPLSDEGSQQQLHDAIEHLELSIKFDPTLAQTFLLLGRAECLRGNGENAVQAFETYTWLRPGNALGHLEAGLAHELEGNSSEAILQWEASGIAPEDFMAAGFEFYRTSLFSASARWYKRASEMGVPLPSLLLYIQYLQIPDKSIKGAHEVLEKAIGIDQGWGEAEVKFQAWYQWGSLLLAQNLYSNAITALQIAIASYPDRPYLQSSLAEVYRMLGGAEWGLGNIDQASHYFQASIELDAENVWSHIHYGKVIFLQNPKNIEQTIKHFDIALAIQPDRIDNWLNLIDFWIWTGETEQVTQLCQQIIPQWGSDAKLKTRCVP